jgi:hypothetical protein
MYWKEGYCWQEEWRERKWCMVCGTGEWEIDLEECHEGNVLMLQRCNEADPMQRFVWKPIFGTGGGKLKPKSRQDLCLTATPGDETKWYGSDRYKLKKCDKNNKSTQIITGWKPSGRFELSPLGQPGRCFSGEHHPKPYEETYPGVCGQCYQHTVVRFLFVNSSLLQLCRMSRLDKTNYWELYSTVGTPPDVSSSLNTDASCKPYDLWLAQNEFIRNGQPVHDSENDFHLEQENNGNLLVRRGNTTIWESGVKGEIGDYYTKLQGDGNMITYNGTFGGDHNIAIWKTASSSSAMTYFLGVDCVDNETVSIYQGAPNHPGNAVWRGDPLPPKEQSDMPSFSQFSEPTTEPPRNAVRTVPFDIAAIEFSNFTENDQEHLGDCGGGPVDSRTTNDEVCRARGGGCAVIWTEEGEMLEFTFEASTDAMVDASVRISSAVTDAPGENYVTFKIDGASGYGKGEGPGKGWDVYEDVTVWNSLWLPAGTHSMKVYFTTGGIDFCSISMKEVMSNQPTGNWHLRAPQQ